MASGAASDHGHNTDEDDDDDDGDAFDPTADHHHHNTTTDLGESDTDSLFDSLSAAGLRSVGRKTPITRPLGQVSLLVGGWRFLCVFVRFIFKAQKYR